MTGIIERRTSSRSCTFSTTSPRRVSSRVHQSDLLWPNFIRPQLPSIYEGVYIGSYLANPYCPKPFGLTQALLANTLYYLIVTVAVYAHIFPGGSRYRTTTYTFFSTAHLALNHFDWVAGQYHRRSSIFTYLIERWVLVEENSEILLFGWNVISAEL